MLMPEICRRTRVAPAFCTFLALLPALAACAPASAAQTPGDGHLQIAELGQCRLESGAIIQKCRVGYRTFGRLNAARDNAVLMPSWLFGTSGDLVGLFGDGSSANHIVDTTRFYGIAIDAFGDGVSSSPSNSEAQHGTDFPPFTLRDAVDAESRVVTEVLGLKHLHAVVGLSMGGEQTFVWAVAHPELFDLAVPIIATPRPTTYDLEVKQIQLEAIFADPDFHDGHYARQPALKLANLFGNLVVTTPEARNAATPRSKFAEFLAEAEASRPVDANDRVSQLRAIMHHDVIGNRTLAAAAQATRAHFLIIVNANDHLVNPQPALDWAAALGAPTYVSHGTCAHILMSCDAEAVSSRVRQFLATEPTP
jgi:homoserine O-acetyltransferase